MRKVNITFQVPKAGMDGRWEDVPITYVMKNVSEDHPIEDVMHCLSTINGFVTVRAAKLFLDDELTPKQACRYNGHYYQANK